MSRLVTCASCQGFLRPQDGTCPHCGAAQAAPAAGTSKLKLGVGLLACLGGGTIAVTLMACYGCPPSQCGPPPPDLRGPVTDLLSPPPDMHPGCAPPDGGAPDGGCGLDR